MNNNCCDITCVLLINGPLCHCHCTYISSCYYKFHYHKESFYIYFLRLYKSVIALLEKFMLKNVEQQNIAGLDFRIITVVYVDFTRTCRN